ncbi:MAG: hypothetical protein MZU97_18755 [Bacillus subtilis]|nr:hypothetical protein [Bacillus subtilis]
MPREIEDPLSEDIIKGMFGHTHTVKAVLEEDKPVFVAAEESVLLSVN